jgi:hypothetical protein
VHCLQLRAWGAARVLSADAGRRTPPATRPQPALIGARQVMA